MLTVAIPVRWSDERSDILTRLSFPKMDDVPADVEILIVDDGSPQILAEKLEAVCNELGYSYHRLESEHLPFSIGRARNAAAQCGLSPYLMFQDVDLMPYPGFYQDVLRECEVARLDESVDNFLMFGVIYLTEQATEEFKATRPEIRRQKFIQRLLEDDKSSVEKFSTGTSVTVWRRDYFLAAGGNDPDFNGWGYEDLEFACRAIRRRKKFPLPSEFTLDYRNFQTIVEYKGWKSIYRLFGDMTFQKGMVMFHAWHPVQENSSYMIAKKKNRLLFEKKLSEFRDKGIEPEPLPMLGSGKSLVFRNNPWVTNRWARPYLGEVVHVDEDYLCPDSLMSFLPESDFTRVVFHNPYANERMRVLYETVRANNFPFIVVERGALPDSVFFDPRGFNADSASYDESRWNHPLSEEKRRATLQYIQDAVSNDDSLEEQPTRLGTASLRRRLNIAAGKKILVAFLQRPTDTVIQHFMGPLGSYDEFLRLLARLPYTLPTDWVLVVKQHPLEIEEARIPGAIGADAFNTKDLLEACDAMIAVNSGVGVLGLLFNKPVLHCGEAFYGFPGVSQQVLSDEDVGRAVTSFKPDREKVIRFVSYLINDFYSFGKFTTRKVRWHDGSLMTATTGIDFYTLRMPGCREVRREIREAVEVSSASILFDRYRSANGQVVAEKSTKDAKNPSRDAATAAMERTPPMSQNKITAAPQKPRWRRKLKKLSENPERFFRDSKFGLLRAIGSRILTQQVAK